MREFEHLALSRYIRTLHMWTRRREQNCDEAARAPSDGRTELRGAIDQWAPVVRGWISDAGADPRPREIAVFVDDLQIAQVVADLPRPDVRASGHSLSSCGFTVDVSPFLRGDHVVRIVDAETSEEVFREHLSAAGGARSPRLGRGFSIATTIRREYGDEPRFVETVERSRRLAVVSAFRPDRSGPRSLGSLIDALKGCEIPVLLVDTSENEPIALPGSDFTLWRANLGWDFGSWFAALERFEAFLPTLDRLYLVNDSCVGPLFDLGALIERGWSMDVDIWSLTDSWQHSYHLQSYFLALGKAALGPGALPAFIADYDYPLKKDYIIEGGEIALTRHVLDQGLRARAVFDYEMLLSAFLARFEERLENRLGDPQVLAACAAVPEFVPADVASLLKKLDAVRSGQALNPSHQFWEELLEAGCPFLKRELLVKDPAETDDASGIGAFFTNNLTSEIRSGVRDDLRRSANRRFIPFNGGKASRPTIGAG